MKLFFRIILFFSCFKVYSQITLLNSGTSTVIRDLSVIGKNIMVNGLQNYLVKSYDDCNSLSYLPLPVSPGYQNQLQRQDSLKLFLFSYSMSPWRNKLHVSLDGGNSWVKKVDTTVLIDGARFFDSQEGIMVRYFWILHTKNGGNTWTSSPAPGQGATVIRNFGESTVAVGDAFGSFYLSRDRGYTWPTWDWISSPIADISFLNKDTIFVISLQGGANDDTSSAYISRTLNGGLNWDWSHGTIPLRNPQAACFKNFNEGYVVGTTGYRSDSESGKGRILKTTDFGKTWTFFDPQINSGLASIRFLNDSIALVGGYDGVLFTWNIKQTLFTALDE